MKERKASRAADMTATIIAIESRKPVNLYERLGYVQDRMETQR